MSSAPDRLLRRLEWQVVRRLDGQLQGPYRTVFRGTGIDFTGLRPYTPEDDVRHIDWNVTARLDEPYVRLYTQDRDLTAWLVLDQSASMALRRGRARQGLRTHRTRRLPRSAVHAGWQPGRGHPLRQPDPACDPGPHRPYPRPAPHPRAHAAECSAPGRHHHGPRRHAATGRHHGPPPQPDLRHLRLHRRRRLGAGADPA